MESFSLPNLFFLSPSLEFGSATGLCPNPLSSGQENTPWPLLCVGLVSTHQVNNFLSCAGKNYPSWRSSGSSCIRSFPMIKKTPFLASSTNLVTVLLFFVSALLAKTQDCWRNPTGSAPPSSTHPFNTNLFLHLFSYLACNPSSYFTRNIEVHNT